MKPFLLYRRTLDARSGAGQLIRMQADGLKAAGARVRLACRRGGVRFFVRTGWPAAQLSAARAAALNDHSAAFVVDHQLELPGADLIFAHGLIRETIRGQSRNDWDEALAREAQFFDALDPTTVVVTCSTLMKSALIEHYGVAVERIIVHYPGFRSDVFAAGHVAALRRRARAALGVADATPLIGFVTSGDFQTRGLDIFLASAERIADAEPEARFLVVGSKRLPEWSARHPLVASGRLLHRPKSGRPELWMSALDVFLYPSRFDAYGIVVAEAQALGVPVLTSRRVGATECMPAAYAPWLIDAPDADEFAERAVRLLRDTAASRQLSVAGEAAIVAVDDKHYVEQCVTTMLAQNA